MHYTPYRPNDKSWIGGLITFIIGIIGFSYIIFSIPSTDAKAESLNQEYSRIDILENAVKELQEKNIELEERLNYMSDALSTNIELVDRLEAKVGL
jgi:Tfp pilus assembly protein PilO